MSLFEEASELVRTGRLWLVDKETGEARDFPASQYDVISDLVLRGRFIPKMSEAAARRCAAAILASLAGRN